MSFVRRIERVMTHPNTLTLYRVAAVPGIVILMVHPNRLTAFFAALLFSLGAITDFFDGFFARRHGLVSNLGKMLDPLADKLLVSSSLIMLASRGWIPGWIVCIILGRELAVTGLRNLASEKGEDTSASLLGKYKTGFQIAAIIPLLLHYPFIGIDFTQIGMIFLWVALALTLWSGADYAVRFAKLLKD